MAITVTLSSAHMGDVDETDFDLWARYVDQTIDGRTGLPITVKQARFGVADEDVIDGATDEQRDAIRRFLSVDGWEAFCGVGGPWETMRREHDAASAA